MSKQMILAINAEYISRVQIESNCADKEFSSMNKVIEVLDNITKAEHDAIILSIEDFCEFSNDEEFDSNSTWIVPITIKG